ncbi:hypothetical protein [Neptuniibacter marinus]|uniref:hypothetical protein n=1 Tax=Neptuniibacter marinus TaxID=1806670 RepID=UPI00082DAC2E|nr:hypothetical protein [Neptuniibacter marinus]
MIEFILVFFISLLVLLGVALALAFGKAPTYRPSRQEILSLLVDVMEKSASTERWEMFLSLPINHDPELENIRKECLLLVFNGEGELTEGINGALLNKATMAELRAIAARLNGMVKAEPISKLF